MAVISTTVRRSDSIEKPETIIAILTNVATLLAFVVFVVPGVVSLRTYEALRGGEGRKINDAIVEIVIYSFATDVVAVPLLLLTAQIPNVTLRYIALAAAGLMLLVGLPIVLGRAGYSLQRRLSQGGVISHPTLKPWDEIFTRIAREKREMGVILTLPDGRKFGGKYVDPGFASEYPADEQLLLGECWIIAQDTGRFVERAAGSYGLLIDKKDVLTVEFIEWSSVEQYLLSEFIDEAKSERQSSESPDPDKGREGSPGAAGVDNGTPP